jgi:hypothetical protein
MKKTKFMHFSLFPLPSLKGCFIEIDKLALHDLVACLDQATKSGFRCFNKQATVGDKMDLFKEVFDYGSESHKAEPNYQAGIKTDGESIRLCMTDLTKDAPSSTRLKAKQKLELDMLQIEGIIESGKTIDVIGLDPGRKRPFTAVNLRHKRQGPHSRLYRTSHISNGHYHQLTWSIRHWHLKAWRLTKPCGKPSARLMAAMPSGRTTNSGLFATLISYVVPALQPTLIPFSASRRLKSWRFRALQHRQSALAFVVKRILCQCDRRNGLCTCDMHRYYRSSSQRAAVVAYGAAKFNPSSQGNAPSPNSRIARGLERLAHVKVVMTDEFRTSKLCSLCHHQLAPPSYTPQLHRYHGVLQCSNSNCRTHGHPWNRDVNASLNMASLLLFALASSDPHARPEFFKRGTASDAQPIELPSFSWFDRLRLTSPSSLLAASSGMPARKGHTRKLTCIGFDC